MNISGSLKYRKYFLFLLFVIIFVSTASAFSEKPRKTIYRPYAGYVNPDYWNLDIGGSIHYSNNNYARLKKAKIDQEKWSSILRLDKPIDLTGFLGQQIYFITEAEARNNYRLAPNFFVRKNGKKYLVWWSQDRDSLSRKYISFAADDQGRIVGSLYLPDIDENQYHYIAQIEGQKPFLVSTSSELTLTDIGSGLKTDWQHDIPGKYSFDDQIFPGAYGEVIFKHFYLGKKDTEAVIPSSDWTSALSEKEKQILSNEFGIGFSDSLKEFQYQISAAKEDEVEKYYNENKNLFDKDPYFKQQNIIKSGDVVNDWQVVAKKPEESISVEDGKFIIKNKKDPYTWTIIKIDEITDSQRLNRVRGVARLSARMKATGLVRGDLSWQNIILEAILLDKQGNQINENQNLCTTPLDLDSDEPQNISGTFVDEFVIGPKVKKIEIVLKIAGAPADDPQKKGVVVDEFCIDKVALQKTDEKLDLDRLFSEVANKQLVRSAGKYKDYESAEHGLIVGDRQLFVRPEGDNYQIIFDINNAEQYAGLYTGLFNLKDVDELEAAAEFMADVNINGSLPDWASLTLQIDYFDENGTPVYAADYGSERYPKIYIDPKVNLVTRKSFFHAPKERGAAYGQVKIHVIRKPDQDNIGFDKENYLTGKLTISNIIVRPSLEFNNKQNWLPNNGNFYKHINGSSLTWDFNGPSIKEELEKQTRQVLFNNDSKQWSSMKTIVNIPEQAQLARGKIKLDISEINTGIAQWQGFGFFLEADVIDNLGNTYHFSGIPVFQMVNNKLVRLERIPKQYSGEIVYYIPLYHEKLKISKLYFQIAMAGSGRATVKPLGNEPHSPLIELEMIYNDQQPDIAAFWSQYALYAAQADNIFFQKNYRMAYNKQVTSYEFAETLLDHLLASERSLSADKEKLEKLKVDEAINIGSARIRAIPSYARVSKEFALPESYDLLAVSFNLDAVHPDNTKFNFKVEMLDANKNVFSPDIYYLNENNDRVNIEDQDVFDFSNNNTFIMPINKQFKTARVILGNNQGDLTYSSIEIKALKNNTDQLNSIKNIDNLKQVSLFQARELSEYDFRTIGKTDNSSQVNTELHGINELLMGPIAVNRDKGTAYQQKLIRNSITAGRAYFQKGTWYYSPNKPFIPVGFTVVGESFNKWFEYRRKEFENKEQAYWLRFLKTDEKRTALNTNSPDEFIISYARAQANIWDRMGINYIRVHQLFSSWSGLDSSEIDLVVKILKIWQKEKGILIDFDLLPNPDLSSEFFAEKLEGKPLTEDLAKSIDLFKAALVLPEVRKEYIEPAVSQIMEVFEANDFWPNAISYCNETGFTHGYWLMDRNNAASHNVLSSQYQKYYTGYLQALEQMPTMRSDIHKLYDLFLFHIESMQVTALLNELDSITRELKQGKRIRAISEFIYYNLLRDDVINSFNSYSAELKSLKNNRYKQLATSAINSEYYNDYQNYLSRALSSIQELKQQIRLKEIENASKLEHQLSSPGFKQNLIRLTAKTLSNEETKPQDFYYIDSFTLDSEQKIFQSFFTSFLLQAHFESEVNDLLAKYSGRNPVVVGLNNDYMKDPFSILQRSYAFSNSNRRMLRFNKYAHHPVGGHSMLLNSGAGSVFDIDSKIQYNLTLFNPLYSLGYPLCLSETNHTYAGGINSGESNWSFIDQIQAMSSGYTVLGFRFGLNNFDKEIISDYFNIANRPNKVTQFNLLAYIAALINTGQVSISEDNFVYNPYSKTVEINNRTLQAVAGEIKKGSSISNQANNLKFTYNGKKDSADITLIKTIVDKTDYLVSMFGIERNTNQINRKDNNNLIQSYGESPILYEYFPGVIEIKVNRWAKYRVLAYYADSKKPVELSKGNYQQDGDDLKIFLLSKDKGIQSLKIEKI